MATHSPPSAMSSSHHTGERRPAIWPWVLMPLVVLLVAYTLHDFQKHSTTTAAAQSQMHSSGDGSEP